MNKLIFMSLILVGCGGGSFDTVGAAGDAGEAGSAGSITGGAGNGGGDAGNSSGGTAGTGGGAGSGTDIKRNCYSAALQDFGGTMHYWSSDIHYCLTGNEETDQLLNLDDRTTCNSCSDPSEITCGVNVAVILDSSNVKMNCANSIGVTKDRFKNLEIFGNKNLYMAPFDDGTNGTVWGLEKAFNDKCAIESGFRLNNLCTKFKMVYSY